MKRFVLCCGILGLLGCGSTAREEQETPEALGSEVITFLESYRSALDRRDESLLPTLYVSDGRFEWLEDGSVRYRSAEDVIASLASLPTEMHLRTVYDGTSIRPVGENAASVTMGFRTTIGEGEAAFEFAGAISMTLERGPSGWQIVTGHTSTPGADGR